MIKLLTLVVVSYAIAIGGVAQSGEADVTGWEHYANKWDVVGPDDTILGTRVLLHPHVNEQPFTRSFRRENPERHHRCHHKSARQGAWIRRPGSVGCDSPGGWMVHHWIRFDFDLDVVFDAVLPG